MPVDTRQHDRALVAAAVADAPGAFAALIEHCDVAIERCLSRLLARWPEAVPERADLRQSLELHLVRNDYKVLRSYRGDARLTTWIHAVGTRHFYAAVKKVARTRAHQTDRSVAHTPAPAPSPEASAVRASRDEKVRAVLAALPAKDQVLVGLLFEQEMTAADAARVLGIEPSGVRMRKKRLLEKLARKLAGLWP